MSLPHTGKFEAKADVWTMSFDGDNWTGTGPGFEDGILPRLIEETPWHQGTHITCSEVATDVLNQIFSEGWTEIYSEDDGWDFEMPPGAID